MLCEVGPRCVAARISFPVRGPFIQGGDAAPPHPPNDTTPLNRAPRPAPGRRPESPQIVKDQPWQPYAENVPPHYGIANKIFKTLRNREMLRILGRKKGCITADSHRPTIKHRSRRFLGEPAARREKNGIICDYGGLIRSSTAIAAATPRKSSSPKSKGSRE